MSRFGFCGPAYQSQSVSADAQVLINFYREHIESEMGKSRFALYPSPGLSLYTTLGLTGPVRAIYPINNRVFAVLGNTLYEIAMPGGALTNRGTISTSSQPVSIAGGPTYLLIVSNGVAYTYKLDTNTLTALGGGNFNGTPLQAAWCQNFFLVLLANSQQWQASAPGDPTTWSGTSISGTPPFADNITAFIENAGYVWTLGPRQSQVWHNAGTFPFPFATVQGGQIVQGCAAMWSAARLDNSIFWLGSDDRGGGIVWRANGFTPLRVSNHAIEYALQSYATISDAIGYAFQDQGHSFYHLYFPTANVSWRYDVEMNEWHQVGYWSPLKNPQTGFEAHHSQCHAYANGVHLVGDWSSANVYAMSINNLTDAGNPIRRVRRAPHISTEQERIFHHSLQVDFETGLGPIPPLLDGAGNARGPQAMLRWSDDGAHTWSNEHWKDCGQGGSYLTRAIWRRLGVSRDRVYELSVSDPIPWRVIDAYLKATPGYTPGERQIKEMAKVA